MNYGELPKRSQTPQSSFAAEIKVVRGGLKSKVIAIDPDDK
jgi:hypothetical protein